MLSVDCSQGWLYHILTSKHLPRTGDDRSTKVVGGMNHFLFVPHSHSLAALGARHLELNFNEVLPWETDMKGHPSIVTMIFRSFSPR